MNEATKTKIVCWGEKYNSFFKGKGIDIGCGPDPVFPDVFPFDVAQGDANNITEYVHEEFDYVFSSHCLEHMSDPKKALQEWWKLVKPGGILFFIVPDEDLYEQGIWPSRFNGDHKATFTISKTRSWSPVSYNVIDLVKQLPNSELVELVLQDHNYPRHPEIRFDFKLFILMFIGFCFLPLKIFSPKLYKHFDAKAAWRIDRRIRSDKTLTPNIMAQIQCIVKKGKS